METQLRKIKTVPSYPATLRAIKVGETVSFEMLGKMYQGMHSARSRLKKEKGMDFQFVVDAEKNLMYVTRIS